jgi:anti-sigma factor RsiW
MFNCDEVIQLLTDYIDGELEPEAQSQLDQHFTVCPPCVSFLQTFKATIELTGTFRCEDIPESVSEKLHVFLEGQLRSQDLGKPAL